MGLMISDSIRSLFGRRTFADRKIFEGFVDHHSHLLPGVDDGVKTQEEALACLSDLERAGFEAVWLTPYVMEDMPNTTSGLQQVFEQLSAAYPGSMQLHLSAEYMLDTLFEERLSNHDLLPLGEEGTRVLVETSCFSSPIRLYDTLERLDSFGYHPVLAHPERYSYMSGTDYERLKNRGVDFQMNVFSLTGAYGPYVKKRAEWLLGKRMYDLSGTDLHRREQFAEQQKRGIGRKYAELLQEL